MAATTAIDIQCKKILDGLESLRDVLQAEPSYHALDLEHNVDSVRNKELLERLIISLDHYTQRGKDLVYVGLMGHFSTGKSSTINALLGVDESSRFARSTGKHPTDKAITLITHSENGSSILNATREGLIPIRSSFIDDVELLKYVVIADTPGAGDPLVIKEITRDYLPICDLLLYFFSAASPLDSSDMPLLREKEQHLKFLPMKVVVTRADEFRKGVGPLVAGNFDEAKAKEFQLELVRRINQSLESTLINESDIVLIDNRSGFNIGVLREMITTFADISNSRNQLAIHSYKVEYFQSAASAIRRFYREFLGGKSVVVARFVETAKNNIERYESKIQITNNGLTEYWHQQLIQIEKAAKKINDQIRDPMHSPDTMEGWWRERQEISEFFTDLTNGSLQKASTLLRLAQQEAVSQLRSAILLARSDIDTIKFDDIGKFTDLLKTGFVFNEDRAKTALDCEPAEFAFLGASKIAAAVFQEFSTYCHDLDKLGEAILAETAKGNPVPVYYDVVERAAEALAKDVESYFDNVTIYRAAVFALSVKDAISRLGIGNELDELEADQFTTENRESMKRDAQNSIFMNRADFAEFFLEEISVLSDECRALSTDTKRLVQTLPPPPKVSSHSNPIPERAALRNEIVKSVEEGMAELSILINTDAKRIIERKRSEYHAAVDVERRQRTGRFIWSAFLVGVVAVAIYAGYVYFNKESVPNTPYVIVGLGALTNIIGSVVGFVFARINDRFPERVAGKKDAVMNEIRIAIGAAVETQISAFQEHQVDAEWLAKILEDYWKKSTILYPMELWGAASSDTFVSLKRLETQYRSLKNRYLQSVNAVCHVSSGYFIDPHKNLNLLSAISAEIKKRSIEPSFELLARTQRSLDSVGKLIDKIEFV